jgi:hypothetical protein
LHCPTVVCAATVLDVYRFPAYVNFPVLICDEGLPEFARTLHVIVQFSSRDKGLNCRR